MSIGINYSGQKFFRIVEEKRVQIQNLLYGLQGSEDWPGYIKKWQACVLSLAVLGFKCLEYMLEEI